MRSLEKLEPAVLHIGDVATYQLEFQAIAVMRTAKKHGLVFQLHALLAIGKYCLDDMFGFILTIEERAIKLWQAAEAPKG